MFDNWFFEWLENLRFWVRFSVGIVVCINNTNVFSGLEWISQYIYQLLKTTTTLTTRSKCKILCIHAFIVSILMLCVHILGTSTIYFLLIVYSKQSLGLVYWCTFSENKVYFFLCVCKIICLVGTFKDKVQWLISVVTWNRATYWSAEWRWYRHRIELPSRVALQNFSPLRG